MRLIDAHSHVHFRAYGDESEDIIRRTLDAGIGMLVVGTQRDTSAQAIEVARAHEGVWAVIGLHPTHTYSEHVDENEVTEQVPERTFDAAYYRVLASQDGAKVVAIGETGMDYYRLDAAAPEFPAIKARMETAFRAQIELALELDLPVMIHCRDAHEDTARILGEYHAVHGDRVRGAVHCFTGTWEEAQRYLAIGFHISFTGVITFKPKRAEIERGETLQDVVRKVPLDRLLVETDAPYLAPEPHRGERNEPAHVAFVAAKVAELKGMDTAAVEKATLENTRALFRLGE